ncbi:sulfotransferase [Thermaurantiacus sp.]
MNWLLSGLLCVLLVEVVRRLPFAGIVSAILDTVGRSIRLVGAPRISDHWKEIAMGAYARTTFAQTFRLGLAIALVIGIALALILGLDWVAPGFAAFMWSWMGIGWTLFFATLWYQAQQRWLRPRPETQVADNGYGAADRVLYQLALDSPSVANFAFKLDQRLVGARAVDRSREQHIFVSGLARSGTTILMRRFHATGEFRSLTYRDMPFALAPEAWRRLSSPWHKEGQLAERAHGDRIEVDFDSPESLDEIFWRVFDGPSYIRSTHLVPHEADEILTQQYRAYVNAILYASRPPKHRYLCKNNNNILRLPTIRRAFPNALLLVSFREPLDHAGSLLRMHRNFLAQQAADPFVKAYMSWLGHHEFGGDHRPFRFRSGSAAEAAPETLDYWLCRWIDAYQYLEQNLPEGAMLVCYELLCDDRRVWASLAERAGLAASASSHMAFSRSTRHADEASFDPDRVKSARLLYGRLRERALKAIEAG